MTGQTLSRPLLNKGAFSKQGDRLLILLFAFLLFAFASGITVANIYYNQPLLASIAQQFNASYATTSIISLVTQLGYASGLLLVVPLGDSFERRNLIVTFISGTALALLAAALSPNLPTLILVSYLIGLIGVTPQFIVAYAAGVAEPENRGRTVGTVMSGLLIGILFSRTRNRINGVYMVCYFIGGALGSAIGSAALAHWHWTGVCLAGATLSLIGLLALFTPWPHLRHSGGPTYS